MTKETYTSKHLFGAHGCRADSPRVSWWGARQEGVVLEEQMRAYILILAKQEAEGAHCSWSGVGFANLEAYPSDTAPLRPHLLVLLKQSQQLGRKCSDT